MCLNNVLSLRISFVIFFAVLLIGVTPRLQAQKTSRKLVDYVDPLIGTMPLNDPAVLGYKLPNGWRSWAGLTFPGSSLPNAMVQLSPITEFGSGAGYEYEDNVIYGFTHTNKGHWNLCHVPLLPVSGNVGDNKFGSHFTHDKEVASPAFYQVYLDDYKVKVSLTSTLRCGFHRYEFENRSGRRILFNLAKSNERINTWEIEQVDDHTLRGYQQTGERIYFYATINHKIKQLEEKEEGTKQGYALLHVSDDKGDAVEVKIALSFVSYENAKQNLETEIGTKSFEEIRKTGVALWESVLSKIQVKGGIEKQKRMLYSCLYRSLLWPALRSDVNGEYTDVKKNVIKADFNYYTIPSLWDTYRNKDVLLGIISPDVTLDVIKSMKDIGDKNGFIPTFFHGDHAASSIAGAYLRGIDDFDIKSTYQLLLKNANVEGGTRPHIKEYIEKGYISDPDIAAPHVETKAKAGVSKTLEYAYDDYSVAQIAKALGDTANYRILMGRSKNYKNVFDPSTRFMRGRLADGRWIMPFNAQYPYYEYMYREANAWQVSFFAPHDTKGLVELYGGPKGFETKLDSLFTLPWNPNHIARNVETMVGQYCHGNQPDHEAPFAYYFIDKPWKSQEKIDFILDKLYGIDPKGLTLSGMDDAGEMSAWYVFSALGFYPYSATDPEYLVTIPLFDEVKWTSSNGKKVVVQKHGTTRKLSSISKDGKKADGYFVPHTVFTEGGNIVVTTE